MAQLVARLHGMEEVWGSNPHSSTRHPCLLADGVGSLGPVVFFRGGDPPEPPGAGLRPAAPLPARLGVKALPQAPVLWCLLGLWCF